MTTVFERTVTCAVCGEEQTVQEAGSTSTSGAMDLDTRPPEMRRSTMWLWVQECTSCGFVAADLGDPAEALQTSAVWHAYLAELNSARRARLANQFLCRSLLDEAAGDLVAAGWRRLHAAWVCDDEQADAEARALRLDAIGLFERARATGRLALEQTAGGDELLLCDLARRAGEFERALGYAEAGLRREAQPFIRELLAMEQRLCAARDAACHNVGGVPG